MSTRICGYYLKVAHNQGNVEFNPIFISPNCREWGVSSLSGILPFTSIFVEITSVTHNFDICDNPRCSEVRKRVGRPAEFCSASTQRAFINDKDYLKLPDNGELLLHHLRILGKSVGALDMNNQSLIHPKGPRELKASFFRLTEDQQLLLPITTFENAPLVTTLKLMVRPKDIRYVKIKPVKGLAGGE